MADKSILDVKGTTDVKRFDPIVFEGAAYAYRKIGEKARQTFSGGVKIK